MFMILILHFDFFSLGVPTHEDSVVSPLSTFFRNFFQGFSIISVNLFVLISGWFGIKMKWKGLLGFLFQTVFILTTVYVIGLALGFATIDLREIMQCFALTTTSWFVYAYLGLYILSPVLNMFSEHATQKQFKTTLILFYILQTYFGYLYPTNTYFSQGYSTISFIGLYLLAQYVKRYHRNWNSLGLYFYAVGITITIALLCARSIIPTLPTGVALRYTNPFNIMAALGLIIYANSLKPRSNKVINFLAASSFAVYLCHNCSTWTINKYIYISNYLFDNFSGIIYLSISLLFMIAVYLAATILDQPRKWLWTFISKKFIR